MRYVRFDVNGVQMGKSVAQENVQPLMDLGYIQVPDGYVEGQNACKLVNEEVQIMSQEEYDNWYSDKFGRPQPTMKQLIIKEYEKRSKVGEDMYKDFQAELVIKYKTGTPLEVIVPLEEKFKPVLDGLNTGDFITAKVGLESINGNNQTEVDFKDYTLQKVNKAIIDNDWL